MEGRSKPHCGHETRRNDNKDGKSRKCENGELSPLFLPRRQRFFNASALRMGRTTVRRRFCTRLVGTRDCFQNSTVKLVDNEVVSGTVRTRLILQERAPPRHQDDHGVDPGRTTESNLRGL